jgi:hypothetical protein
MHFFEAYPKENYRISTGEQAGKKFGLNKLIFYPEV